MSSGIHDGDWKPGVPPKDSAAAETLRAWLADPGSTLYALDLDFRDAHLPGADFIEAWLSRSNFSGCDLSRSLLWRAHCEEADFSGADLTDAELIKSFLTGATFAGARMAGARLGRAECIGTSFTDADLRRSDIGDAVFIDCDMRSADLRESTVTMAAFNETDLTDAKVIGMTGSIVGSIVLGSGEATTRLDGVRLEQWLSHNGANVSVVN